MAANSNPWDEPSTQGPFGDQNPNFDYGQPHTATSPDDAGIAAAYRKYLGRDIGEDEYKYWRNTPNYEQGISQSDEAKKYAASKAAPSGPPASQSPFAWGTKVNLDPATVRKQIENAFTSRGMPINQSQVEYFLQKALKPDLYSDMKWRVGWNPYWEQRMISQSGSADPNLAGTEGLIANPESYGLFDTGGGPSGGRGGTPSASTNVYGGPITGGVTGSGNLQSSELYNLLMQRAQQGLNVNPKDPIIAAQTNAFRAEQERNTRNQLAALAEAQGPQTNLAMERRMAGQGVAQATGSLQSQLMQNELMARRKEVSDALSQMGGLLTEDQRLGLQRELGLIDSSIRRQQIDLQRELGLLDVGLRRDQLAQTNNQFLDELNFQTAQWQRRWDDYWKNPTSTNRPS